MLSQTKPQDKIEHVTSTSDTQKVKYYLDMRSTVLHSRNVYTLGVNILLILITFACVSCFNLLIVVCIFSWPLLMAYICIFLLIYVKCD